jgi:hypothetical protein
MRRGFLILCFSAGIPIKDHIGSLSGLLPAYETKGNPVLNHRKIDVCLATVLHYPCELNISTSSFLLVQSNRRWDASIKLINLDNKANQLAWGLSVFEPLFPGTWKANSWLPIWDRGGRSLT